MLTAFYYDVNNNSTVNAHAIKVGANGEVLGSHELVNFTQNSLGLYPNPTYGSVKVNCPNPYTDCHGSIYSIDGTLIDSFVIDYAEPTISLNNIA